MSAQVALMNSSFEHPPVATADFCKAMRNLAGHCAVIASGDAEQRAGLTVTAVCSLTAQPPRLLVCINRNVYAHGVISACGHLSVNVLGSQQEPIARRFAGMVEGVAGEQRFDEGAWVPGISQVPVLSDALVSFECRLVEAIPASTHDMFICEVIQVAGQMAEEDPLIYFNGQFAALA
jgi:flavin reductase (DIM6/NTAB) family NADH-FMN oxidoreductase RutF